MAEYTKGAWEAKGTRVVIPQKGGFTPTIQNPIFVVAQCSTYCEVDGAEAEANANLIAAAPDMYEALKKSHSLITSIIPNDLVSKSAKHTMQRLIIKALAKVEGKA